jgi:hydrogenase expression/formation protein HypE
MKSNVVTLAHGSGGKLTRQLIEEHFWPRFTNPALDSFLDSSILEVEEEIAFTTDAFVVKPIFFPGGNIGKLAVCGTINDLASVGAQPVYLSASFILEEGLAWTELDAVLESMAVTANEAKVRLVAGDTKVVERGAGDKIYISTSGIGYRRVDPVPQPKRMENGDAILITGAIGNHGLAVLQARNSFFTKLPVESDCAPLWGLVEALVTAKIPIHAMRDPTRGGLATVANELAQASRLAVTLQEDQIPIDVPVQAACDMLGLDPLTLANEGKLVIIVPSAAANEALRVLHLQNYGCRAKRIGDVQCQPEGLALLRSRIGGTRILESLSGEPLPRIC